MQSIYSQLVYEQNRGIRQLDSLKFIWVQRDPVFVKDSELVRDVPIIKQTNTDSVADSDDDSDERMLCIGPAYLATIPQEDVTDDDLTKYYDALKSDIDESVYNSVFSNTGDIESQKKEDNTKFEHNDNVFDLQIYITDTKSGPIASHIPNVQHGRPDIHQLFRRMKEDIVNRGGEHERVAVCVCAPSPIVEVCRTACIIYSNDRIRFDIHLESICV
jgi:hypothetical protein